MRIATTTMYHHHPDDGGEYEYGHRRADSARPPHRAPRTSRTFYEGMMADVE
jgi:hypothetical protein